MSETGLKEPLGHGSACSECMPLTERPRRVLNAMSDIKLRVTGTDAAPLAQLLNVIHRELALQRQHGVEHGTHVAGVEEEAVAACPIRIGRVINQVLREEHIDEIGSTHRTTGVARLSLFYHARCQYTDVVGSTIH